MNRVALIGIMIEDNKAFSQINEIIHDYSQYVVGRMGLPNVRENLNVISIVLDAPNDVINTVKHLYQTGMRVTHSIFFRYRESCVNSITEKAFISED